jgi:hypothetical protein
MEYLIMAGSDYYRTGKGIFGGPGGTYGRYGVSQMAGNLSSQFDKSENIEEKQRRRFKRKRESGYSGAGFWFANYPYMIGAMSSGTDPREGNVPSREQAQNESGESASTASGLGSGGTAAGFVGGLD